MFDFSAPTFRVSTVAQLGDPLFTSEELGSPEPMILVTDRTDQLAARVVELSVTIAALQTRIANLEARTWPARWARFLAWVRSVRWA